MTNTVHSLGANNLHSPTLLPIIIKVFLEPVFLPFLSRRFRNLKFWNINGLHMLLRKRARGNPRNLVLGAVARALARNLSSNPSLEV